MLSISPLAAPFGVDVSGIDLSRPMGDDVGKAVLRAFYEHQLLVFRHDLLEPSQFIRFGRFFGKPYPHPLRHLRHPGHPEILPLSNIVTPENPNPLHNSSTFWHTDQSWEEEPPSATILHAIKAPQAGGETFITNMTLAYDALPASMKNRIGDLMVAHVRDEGEKTNNPPLPLERGQSRKMTPVYHPLVRPHPITGRRVLYAVAGTAQEIRGMCRAESDELLAELENHAVQPEFVYSHRYRVGDVLVFDTAATMHMAAVIEDATGPHDSRLLHRISVKGQPPLVARATANRHDWIVPAGE